MNNAKGIYILKFKKRQVQRTRLAKAEHWDFRWGFYTPEAKAETPPYRRWSHKNLQILDMSMV